MCLHIAELRDCALLVIIKSFFRENFPRTVVGRDTVLVNAKSSTFPLISINLTWSLPFTHNRFGSHRGVLFSLCLG
jgi:hypothetical protein